MIKYCEECGHIKHSRKECTYKDKGIYYYNDCGQGIEHPPYGCVIRKKTITNKQIKIKST